MPIFSNNAFSVDNNTVKAERLQLIQTNYAGLATEIGDCRARNMGGDMLGGMEYADNRHRTRGNEAVGATTAFNNALVVMRNEYMIAKNLIN